MTSDEAFDDDFSDLNNIFPVERMIHELEKAIHDGNLKGQWKINRIDNPHVKGYVFQGSYRGDQPVDPFLPFNPIRRPPMPQRPFAVTDKPLNENSEPLIDMFNEDTVIKIYAEMRGEDKQNIQLNVSKGKVEIKGANFYQTINLPTANVEIAKITAKHRNGVLEINIPKKEIVRKKNARTITID